MRAQYFDDLLIVATQTTDRFENRQGSFARSVLFETLSSADAYVAIETEVTRERIGESRLADTCFAGNEHDLTFACEHLRQQTSHSRQRFVRSEEHTSE